MNRTSFDQARRDDILREWLEARREYEDLLDETGSLPPWSPAEMDKLSEADTLWGRMEEARRQYFSLLPQVSVGVCPYCAVVLVRAFDPYGFEGFYWRPDAAVPEPECCAHFRLLLGAVSYGDRVPISRWFEVRPGPEVPFVVPRILELESMAAVIGRIDMHPGYVAYPISYFAEEAPPPSVLTAPWARTLHTYRTDDGRHGWRAAREELDFDLAPWIAKERLYWCPPDSGNKKLNLRREAACPYLDLPGRRKSLHIRGTRVW